MLSRFFKPVVQIPMVRLGSERDGGYYVPKKIIKISKKIISCGLGEDWSFEEAFIKLNKNIEISFYDHTVGFLFWFKHSFKAFYFFLRYGANFKNIYKYFYYLKFLKNKKIKHLKYKISQRNNENNKEISLSNILKFEKNLTLKIDIEGDEYKVLKHIITHQKKINCLIIEFHQINKNKKKIKNFFSRAKDLKNCNISPNNSGGTDKFNDPLTVEVILINKIFLKKNDYKKKINILYELNNPYKKAIRLKFK